MANLGETDLSLGRKIGMSRQAVHAKRTGRTAITADDMAAMAQALDVDPAILLGPPHEAVAWLAEHRADELDARCAAHPFGAIVTLCNKRFGRLAGIIGGG